MLDVVDIATKWGHIFGGVNQFDTFRGTTVNTRANTISADYTTAVEQRLASEGLYNQMLGVDSVLQGTIQYFFSLAQGTLQLACLQDTSFPIKVADATVLLQKLISDMVLSGNTFQEPTVQVGGAISIAASNVTTSIGTPFGNGVIVGTVSNPVPTTAVGAMVRMFPLPETVTLECSADSYTDGITPANETFAVGSYASVSVLDSLWPKGSGVSTDFTSQPSSGSDLFKNAYFETWDAVTPNLLSDWSTANLTPGTTIFQTTGAYTGVYAVRLTAAPLNAEIFQLVSGLQGGTNYLAGIRIKRATPVTGGVIRVSLRDSLGVVLQDRFGANLEFTYALTGAAGDYVLTWDVWPVNVGFPSAVYLSIKVTTAMIAAESVDIDTSELLEMQSLYAGGPDIGFLPGSIPWALGDTYQLVVTNTAGKTTFLRNIQRAYPEISPTLSWPVDSPPTISDALIV
jgi:hypothetical protein